uniref:F-box domain-containing protein n=1 Tax=Mycena chlorophos TaxID=658473 RepID=A0ABQ0LWT1_MYCCL|nr:predicted protein [Mycena chlorophos]
MAATESPFNDLLHTNTVPSDEQCDEIRTYLNPIRKKLSQLDAEIVRLLEKRDALQTVVSAHEVLISPMRRIPDDVWGMIFLETLPEGRNTALHATEGPLLLVQVCRYWRDLAYSIPRLWASMHVVVGDAADDAEAVGHIISEIAVWLKRSGAVPLAVTLARTRGNPSRVPERSATRTVLELLLPEIKRWRDIQLTIPGIEDLSTLGLLTVSADAPQLSKFELKFTGAPLAPQQRRLDFLSTPSLRKLSFVGPYSMLSESIQWQNLKVIHVNFASRVGARIPFPYPFLSHCTSVEKLSLHFSGMLFISSLGDMDPVQLSQVTMLHLSFLHNGPTETGPLLHHLSFPALHTLCIWEAKVPHPRSLFDSPGFTGIKCLVFPGSTIASTEMYAILVMLPLLERLRLLGAPTATVAGEVPSDGHFLSRFVLDVQSTAQSPLCPSLQHLEFTMLRHTATTDELILRFLRSRSPPTNITMHTIHAGVKPLIAFSADIRLTGRRKDTVDLEKELSGNIACGLKLKLCYQQPGNAVLYSRLHGTERHPLYPQAYNMKPEREWLLDFAPASFFD